MGDRSLRESMLECVDDLDGISKQISEMLLNRGNNTSKEKKKAEETLTNLTGLYVAKQKEMKSLAAKIPQFQEREKLIHELTQCVEQRNKVINDLEMKLKVAERTLISAVFQANKKVASVKQSESRPVDSEEVIRFAHQISRSYSVAAPLFWQQGDPSRPFPTEPEFRNSHLMNPRSVTAPNPINMIRSTVGNIRTPPVGTGRMSSPLVAGQPNLGRPWATSSPSPRIGFPGASPRGRPPLSTPTGRSEASPFQKKSNQNSPRMSSPSMMPVVNIQGTSAPRLAMPTVNAVEQMSSDSSSSSSSEDEGQS